VRPVATVLNCAWLFGPDGKMATGRPYRA